MFVQKNNRPGLSAVYNACIVLPPCSMVYICTIYTYNITIHVTVYTYLYQSDPHNNTIMLCTPGPHHIHCTACINPWSEKLYAIMLYVCMILLYSKLYRCMQKPFPVHSLWSEPQTHGCPWEPWLPCIYSLSECVHGYQKPRDFMLTTNTTAGISLIHI